MMLQKVALGISLVSVLPLLAFAALWAAVLGLLGLMWVGDLIGIV